MFVNVIQVGSVAVTAWALFGAAAANEAALPAQQVAETPMQDRLTTAHDTVAGGAADHEVPRPTADDAVSSDPIVELEEAALAKWKALLAETGRNGALTHEHWPGNRIAQDIPLVGAIPFSCWDKNHDGRVEEAEGKWLLEVAYGLTQPNGHPLRTATGRVFSWYYFRSLDTNDDGALDFDEFVSGHHSGRERNAEIFRELDADADNKLTDQETLPLLWYDTRALFADYDHDRDGDLTTEEFLAIGWGTNVARRSVGAFDDDGDRKISLREFRGTTFANQASDWPKMRRDADDDGRLSWKEFYIERPPILMAQSRYFFDRFDTNKDGYLSLGELEFDVNIDKVPPNELFRARDSNDDGKLVFREFFTEPKPIAGDVEAFDRYEIRLAAEENRFREYDRDSNGCLELAEFLALSEPSREAAGQQSRILSDRRALLGRNYYLQKGGLIAGEIVLLGIVWWVVRTVKPRHKVDVRG